MWNGFPVYQNNQGMYLFRGNNSGTDYWCVCDQLINDITYWYYYALPENFDPTNEGKAWTTGRGPGPGGYVISDCPSSSSSSQLG